MNLFAKASRKQAKLKMLIDGTSGAGKTHSALLIAKQLGKKIAAIDSENHSVEKKPDVLLEGVDVANLEERTIDKYVEYIKNAEESGYDVILVDSFTHPWFELLEEVDRLAKTKYGGNTFRAWSEGTPKQHKLINAILFSKCHLICTGRVKTEWVIEQNTHGKMQPNKKGLETKQGKDIEFEFDIWMRINEDHYGTILKDRFDIGLQDKIIAKPGVELGKQLKDYFDQGDDTEIKINELFNNLNLSAGQRQKAREKYPDSSVLLEKLQGQVDKK